MSDEKQRASASQPTSQSHRFEQPLAESATGGSGGDSSRTILSVVLGVIVLAALAGGAYAGYVFMSTERLSPEEVMSRMIGTMQELDSFAFNGNVNVDGSVSSQEFAPSIEEDVGYDVTYGMSGEVEGIKSQNPRVHMEGDVSVSAVGPGDMIPGSASETVGVDVSASGAVRYLDNTVYAKLTDADVNFDGIGGLQAGMARGVVEGVSSSFSDQWIRMDLSSTLGGYRSHISEEDLQQMQKMQSMYVVIFEELLGSDAFRIEGLKDEKIDGHDAYHYKIMLDFEKLPRVYRSIMERFENEGIVEAYSEQVIESEIRQIQDVAQNMDDAVFEIWVDKNDFYLRKISLDYTLEASGTEGSARMEITYSDFNTSFNISAPSQARTFEEVMQELFRSMPGDSFGGGLFGGRQQDRDASEKANLSS